MNNVKPYDFSCKRHILLEDEQGVCVPMSEPYFRSWQIAPRTWRVLSDGDYSYLLEGDDGDALLIDSGYGAGSIREYCEQLIGRPVPRIVNTHDHFDHTANNGYFDLAYMSKEIVPLATLPFPSFEGITFPRNYTIQIVEDGDFIPLKGRDLRVLGVDGPGYVPPLQRGHSRACEGVQRPHGRAGRGFAAGHARRVPGDRPLPGRVWLRRPAALRPLRQPLPGRRNLRAVLFLPERARRYLLRAPHAGVRARGYERHLLRAPHAGAVLFCIRSWTGLADALVAWELLLAGGCSARVHCFYAGIPTFEQKVRPD